MNKLSTMRARLIARDVIKPDADIGLLAVQHERGIPPKAQVLSVTAMTDRVALDNMVVVPRGVDRSYIDQNKRVFCDHDTDFFSCVGIIRNITVMDASITADIALATSHPDYADMMTLASEVGLGVSIGFEALEVSPPRKDDPPHYFGAGLVVRKWRWLELSLTMMPCDAYSKVEGMRSASSLLAVRSATVLARSGRVKWRILRSLGVRDERPRVRIDYSPAKG